MSFPSGLALFIVFLACNLSFAELHSDPQKAKLIFAALKQVGELTDADVKNIESSGFYPMGLLDMVDPLVHRQGSPEPLKKALPGPGFKELDTMLDIVKKNPNADVLPKMTTKFWSKELKAKLLPVLEEQKIGTKKGDERELTASQVLDMLSLSRLSGAPPIPGEDASKNVKVSQEQWREFRDHLGELALAYQRTLQGGAPVAPAKVKYHIY